MDVSRRPLLDLVVDLSASRSDRIVVYPDSDPAALALEFQLKHGLSPALIPHLLKHIHDSTQQVLAQQTKFEVEEDTLFDSFSLQSRKDCTSVFDRLSCVRRLTEEEPSRVQPRVVRPNSARVVERLYSQSKLTRQQQERKRQKEHKEREQQQLKECTHRPKIGAVSRVLASSRARSQRVEQRLIETERGRQESIQKMRTQRKLNQLQGCSFKPQIGEISKEIVALKDLEGMSRYSQRQMPTLEQSSKQRTAPPERFLQRAQAHRQRKKVELAKLMQEKENRELYDPATGRPFFVPAVISSAPETRKCGKSIAQYLYSRGKRVPAKESRPTFKAGTISALIVEGKRRRRAQQIFAALDSDCDGVISAQRISLEGLAEEALELLAPVLVELEDFGFSLSCEEFVQALQVLDGSLNPLQKRVLYG